MKPAGVQPGDVLLAVIATRGKPALSAPTGWILELDTISGTSMRQAVYRRVADGTEPISWTWTFSYGAAAGGAILAYAGVDAASPIEAKAGQANGSGSTIPAPSIETVTPNSLLVALFGIARTATINPDAPMVERYEVTSPAAASTKLTAAGADEVIAQPGLTGQRSATANGSAASVGQVVALRPSATAPSAQFRTVPSSGVAPLTVRFVDESRGAPTAWAWDFQNDGVVDSTDPSPTFTYTTPGTYSPKLVVTNAQGSDSRLKVGQIRVDPPPATSGTDPVFVGAGDIASCTSTGDEATADLLDAIAGTVFAAGDTVYPDGTDADYANCYEPSWGRHKGRTRPAVGNHEYHVPGAAGYFSYFGAAAGDPSKGYYSFDLGSWHIIVLNSECTHIGGCLAGSPQEVWLRQDLAANAAQCTLAIMHKPLFSSGRGGPVTSLRAFWVALHEAGAELVLQGHDHNYERIAPVDADGRPDPKGIRPFVVGMGGVEMKGLGTLDANSERFNGSHFGVMKLTLHATGYTWEFVPVAGSSYTDTGTAACHGPNVGG